MCFPIVVGCATLAGACHATSGTPSLAELRAVPMEAVVDGRTLYVESYLWRDYMPITPPEGKPLTALFRVRAREGGAAPAVTVDSAWVVYGSSVWATAPRMEHAPATSGELELIARNGPLWPAGSTVDVVLRVRGSRGITLLRAPQQLIRRTD